MRNPFNYRFGLPSPFYDNEVGSFTAFSPSALFAANEPGVWFDPSDLTTLFQDPAGTTPVTTPGQTVGLMLDKSKGLALGAELVTNGTFTDGFTGFTASGTGTREIVDGSGKFTITGAFYTNTTSASVVSGRTYILTADMTGFSSVGVRQDKARIQLIGATNGFIYASVSRSSFRYVFTAATNTLDLQLSVANAGAWGSAGDYALYDNISVRELAGNHATQATAVARPNYAIEPAGGRRNLLTWSEDFGNAAWVKAGSFAVDPNTYTAPDGSLSADTLTTTAGTEVARGIGTISGTAYAASVSIRKTSGATVFPMVALNGTSVYGQVILNTNTGAASVRSGLPGATNLNVVSQGDYWRVSFSFTTDATTTSFLIYPAASTNGTSYGSGLSGSQVVWGAQLETATTATAYQKVTTQYDVTEAGVASMSYLYFDGVNDAMATSTITPGIDKAQVFAGVRKLSDATRGILVEAGATGTDLGSFGFNTPRDATRFYLFTAGGSLLTSSQTTSSAFAAPVTNVISGLASISGDSNKLRLNGTDAAETLTDQGTGNFLAYPLFIGARGGTSLFFIGHLYSLITRFGANLDTPTITNTETWVAGKTGFFTPVITGVPTIGVS